MATAPVKSQPLHNFALPFLKWGGKSHTNSTTRCRRTVSPASSEPDSDYHHDSDPPSRVGSRSARNRFGFSPCSFNNNNGNSNKQAAEHSGADDVADVEAAAEAEEGVQKPWKLRPRKAVQRSAMVEIENTTTVTTVLAIPAPQAQNENPKSMRLRGDQSQSTETKKKKEKNKFWIALSKEEIEEDVFIMTGSRPARRPRKRPKNVQKQLDVFNTKTLSLSLSVFWFLGLVAEFFFFFLFLNGLDFQSVFPGLWLVGTTADSYRVAEAPAKVLSLSISCFFFFVLLWFSWFLFFWCLGVKGFCIYLIAEVDMLTAHACLLKFLIQRFVHSFSFSLCVWKFLQFFWKFSGSMFVMGVDGLMMGLAGGRYDTDRKNCDFVKAW